MSRVGGRCDLPTRSAAQYRGAGPNSLGQPRTHGLGSRRHISSNPPVPTPEPPAQCIPASCPTLTKCARPLRHRPFPQSVFSRGWGEGSRSPLPDRDQRKGEVRPRLHVHGKRAVQALTRLLSLPSRIPGTGSIYLPCVSQSESQSQTLGRRGPGEGRAEAVAVGAGLVRFSPRLMLAAVGIWGSHGARDNRVSAEQAASRHGELGLCWRGASCAERSETFSAQSPTTLARGPTAAPNHSGLRLRQGPPPSAGWQCPPPSERVSERASALARALTGSDRYWHRFPGQLYLCAPPTSAAQSDVCTGVLRLLAAI